MSAPEPLHHCIKCHVASTAVDIAEARFLKNLNCHPNKPNYNLICIRGSGEPPSQRATVVVVGDIFSPYVVVAIYRLLQPLDYMIWMCYIINIQFSCMLLGCSILCIFS